ncbi:MAG: hypothetical protein HY318_12305, partial [Armatimonadetes bacterium]|nr:hypothetical protein [Armatimonadota bacterium]
NIHYFDSMGWHDVARRAMTYFLEKEHEDGFMQNFTGYMLDTGCVLFALGEHYRYTRDDDWVKQIASKVLKSCDFLLNWRARNLKEDLRGRGYGMMEGQVADPKDHERIFMLNAYACVGLARAAEMLEKTDLSESRRLRAHAESFRADLRAAFFESLARGPVVPLGDGTWSPTSGPWAGSCGPKCLFTDGGNWWTHGSMTARDDIIGPIHLASLGILDPGEQATGLMLDYLSELMFSRNVCASQPYYSQHPLLHLRRGEVKRFLKAYYNTMASMADREIYSFWEHFYHESPHKTHEEAEFLMQTRWMLYLEDGETLKLLQGVPRAWFENGKRIKLDKVGSYFGPLSLEVESRVDQGLIGAKILCDPKRKPKRVEIRLPHPRGKRAVSVEGGTYDADRETVLIEGVEECAEIYLRFN